MPNDIMMAFDFGMTRIGIAVGQTITGTATPLKVINATDGVPDWNQVKIIVDDWKPRRLIVGLPLNMDGTESDMSERANKFARRLTGRFNIPSTTMDERLSTREARELSDQHREVDSIAAKLILESYFREQVSKGRRRLEED